MFGLCDGGSAHGEHGDGEGSISARKGVGNKCMDPQWAMAENKGGKSEMQGSVGALGRHRSV